MRSTPATRAFTDEPVPDEVLYRMLEHARFAPSGGNRQSWRVLVLKDPAVRELLGIPEGFAVAALLAIGKPVKVVTRLRRGAVADFAVVDRFDGPAFGEDTPSGN